jgi:hypothetical protein
MNYNTGDKVIDQIYEINKIRLFVENLEIFSKIVFDNIRENLFLY